MSLRFTKMHGLGNDFIVVDVTKQKQDFSVERVQKLADRHTGVGFDQLLLLETSPDKEHDFVYRIFNADGQEVEQCGNGARCIGHYLFTEKLPHKDTLTLSTLSGKIVLKKEMDGQITVNMGIPNFAPESLPFLTEIQKPQYQLQIENEVVQFGAVSIGNPHVVICVKDILEAPVQQIGEALQQHPAFPNQVNVGFMEILSPYKVYLRVFERGVGETRACGSGACAAMVIGRLHHGLQPDVKVELLGGSLNVFWSSNGDDVYLTGPAEKVFTGELI